MAIFYSHFGIDHAFMHGSHEVEIPQDYPKSSRSAK